MRRFALAWTLGSMLLGLAAPAAAQTLGTDELSAVTFRPSPGTNRYLGVDGVEIGRQEEMPIDLMVDYAYRPLYVDTFCAEPWTMCVDDVDQVAVVSEVLAFHLGAALPIGRRVEIGLSVPILHASGDGWEFDDVGGSPRAVDGGSATGLGDPELSVRGRLFGGAGDGFGLAAVVYGTVPLGQLTMEGRYVGDDLPNVGGHLVGEAFLDEVRGAVTLGALYRAPRELTSEVVGPMLTYAGAVEWRASDLVAVLGELEGGVGLGDATAQLELRAAGRLALGPVDLTAGTGVGVVRGPGVPWVRVFAGVRWAPLPAEDRDGDGVPDAVDECPDAAEDADGFEDDDGCADLDNDGDQVPDADDRCPNDAEDRDGHDDEDGCPDNDDDGDGVPDGYDSCLDEQEDHDGDRDEDGCPDLDRDGDGVNDDVDRCPDEPEDTDGLMDEDGCPEEDADNDGIPDVEDECADVYGTDCHEEPAPPGEGGGGGADGGGADGGGAGAGADAGAGSGEGEGEGGDAGTPPGPTEPTPPAQQPDAGAPPPVDDGDIDWSPP